MANHTLESAREYVQASRKLGKPPARALAEFLQIRPLEETEKVLRHIDELEKRASQQNVEAVAEGIARMAQEIKQLKVERIDKLELIFLNAIASLGAASAVHLLPLMLTAAGDEKATLVKRLRSRVAPELVQIHRELKRYETL